MICPVCHAQNPAGARFCVQCATPLPVDPQATTSPPSAATTPSQPLQPYAGVPSQPYQGVPGGYAGAPPSQPLPGQYSTPYPTPYSTPLSQPLPPYTGYPAPMSQPLVPAPSLETPAPGVEIFGADAHPATARPYTRMQAFLLRNLSARVAVSTWFMAAIGAVTALATGLILTAVVQAFLSNAISNALTSASSSSSLSSYIGGSIGGILTPDVLKLFALEHRIPLDVSAQVTSESVQAGGGLTLTLPITALLLIPAVGLVLGGYISASSDYSRNPRYSLARGALVGPVYAILVAIVALLGSSTASGGLMGVSGSVTVAPSVFLAFVYALIWGCLFGAIGGWLQLYGRHSVSAVLPSLQRIQRGNVTGAIAGAAVALVTGLLLFIALELGGVLLLNTSAAATINTSGTALSGVPLSSSLVVGLIAAFAPTLALYLFSLAAGASLDTYATASVGNANQANHLSLLGSHPGVPAAVYLIVLVPLIAYFVGGWVAARAALARDPGAGLAAGALMALPLSILAALGSLIAGASIDLSVLGVTASEGVSPSVGGTFLVVLLGGAIVGGLGGAAAVSMPSLGRLPRALLFPIRPFGFAVFPLFDRISAKPRGTPRSAARLWLYDGMLAAIILGILVVVLDVTAVAIANLVSWNIVVTLFAVLSGLLVALPLVLISGSLVAGILSPATAVPVAAPAYSISASVPLAAPGLAAPGDAPAGRYALPYAPPSSAPYSPPYSSPYSGPSGAYATPPSAPLGTNAAGAVGAWPDATIPDETDGSTLGRGQLPPSND